MTTNASTFVFRLTSLCDKKCMLCCNNYAEIKRVGTTPFDDLLARFSQIRDYRDTALSEYDRGALHFILTGGEALLYTSSTARGRVGLYDVIAAIHGMFPRARVIVKTGGFRYVGHFLPGLFDRIAEAFPFPAVEFRLGLNLYQDEGMVERTAQRFACMASRALAHQHFLPVDTIYDRSNLTSTCKAIEEGLRLIGIDIGNGMLLRTILKDAHEHRQVTIRSGNDAIIIDLGPSYPPNRAAKVHEYYCERSSECNVIECGTSSLYYDIDLALIHCNDSFVDARVAPLAIGHRPITEQVDLLNQRFARLSRYLAAEKRRFASRQERCFFCTQFVMTTVGDRASVESEGVTN